MLRARLNEAITRWISSSVAKADAAGQDGALFEARMLFSTIFGSEDFEALVGQFSMAAEMAVEGREVSADERKFRQLLREVECAAALAARLDGAPADGSSDEAFCSAQAAFAATLCGTPFGQRRLHLVGSTYVALADAYLASFAEGVALTIGHEAQRLGSRLSVVGAFAGAASSTHRAMRAEKEKAEADAEASQSELRRVQTAEHAAAAALDAVDILWRVCVCDVEATLGAVVHKCARRQHRVASPVGRSQHGGARAISLEDELVQKVALPSALRRSV